MLKVLKYCFNVILIKLFEIYLKFFLYFLFIFIILFFFMLFLVFFISIGDGIFSIMFL